VLVVVKNQQRRITGDDPVRPDRRSGPGHPARTGVIADQSHDVPVPFRQGQKIERIVRDRIDANKIRGQRDEREPAVSTTVG